MLINPLPHSIAMKRIFEYQMLPGEFDALVEHLKAEGRYKVHGYRGMSQSTIDDGCSTDFERCRQFSTFQPGDHNGPITLRVEDSTLAGIVDLYFVGKR